MSLKSNQEDLKKRGMIEQADIELFSTVNDDVLYQMIDSKVAAERTVAVHLLAERSINDIRFVRTILQRLCKEKSLYTKLEICLALEKGNIETAKQMVKYLGIIGDNQHIELPDRVSKKICFPLPRDIMARSFRRMSPTVINVLLEVLEENDTARVAEVLDAIGYMMFYNQELATPKNAQYIFNCMEKHTNNLIVLWKSVMCLSAFPIESSITVLERIKSMYPNSIIAEEASRSLRLIRIGLGRDSDKK